MGFLSRMAVVVVLLSLSATAVAAAQTAPTTSPPTTSPPTTSPPTTSPPTTAPPTTAPPTTAAPTPSPAPRARPAEPARQQAPDTTPPSIGLRVTHPHFSPNGDAIRDRTFVELVAQEPVVVDLLIRNARGTARKTEQFRFGPGAVTATWGGRIQTNGAWGRAADGNYTFRITATDATDNATVKTRTVMVDTVRPTFAWTAVRPDSWGGTGAVSYDFTSNDASGPLVVQASAWSRIGRLDLSTAVEQPRGAIRFGWRPNYSDGSLFLPGNYLAAVTVTDQAGNFTVSPFRGFRVERAVTSVVVRRVEGAGSRVALTFDDCDDGAAWTSILATLERYGVHATFFCPATEVLRHPAQARATATAGHSIGSHSNGHAQLTRLPYADIVARLRADQDAWWSTARVTPSPYFRPPYGSYNATVLAAAGNAGFRYTVTWDVDTNDWQGPGASVITDRAVDGARSGSIILMHVRSQTAAALPAIVSGLRSRGLQPSSLAQLFNAAGWH